MCIYIRWFRKVMVKAIGEYRHKNNFTQEEMAERLHISARAYSDLERGRFFWSARAMIWFLFLLDDSAKVALIRDFETAAKRAERETAA